ncbi:putative RDD family membrane protein YckC [Paenibacillus sp. V4I9]|uniref:RDD family protein n=1 Tax=Paenibacillus sp. V4I9 TaxID=3042308 RepID=UPI00278846EE|nr:RDD family protein [Paenibacillus sp. V4I9]MDQ0888864.1 putative RDD family membrane protein YckC [Paenibacillus sp. V4I9]
MIEWFYKIKKEIHGPFTVEELMELIRAGRITKSTLVRKHKFGEWLAAEIYTEFEWNEEKTKVRPWLRLWARYLDSLLFVYLIQLLDRSSVPFVSPIIDWIMYGPFIIPGTEEYVMTTILLLVWIPLESLLLSLVGTTPGKFLFGVKVRNPDGARLSLRQACKRSFLVWWRGEAAGIPVIYLFTHASAYQTLKNKLRQTTWDREMNIIISHRPTSIWLEAIYYVIVAGLVYYSFFG